MTYLRNGTGLTGLARGPKGDTGDVSAATLAATIAALKAGVDPAGDTLAELYALILLRATIAGTVTHTGVHNFVTQANGNNSTKAATTEFVQQELTNYAQPLDALLTSLAALSPSGSGIVSYASGTASFLTLDTDGTLAANSDARIPTQKAVKTAIAASFAANDALINRGGINCSANPNYPAADNGDNYFVTVAGKIGGASGPNVEAGDRLVCNVDSSAAGTHAAVGANWNIVQTNLDGAVIGPASVTDDLPAIFDGITGKLIKSKTYAAFKTLLALVKGDVGLGNVDNTSDATKDGAAATLTSKTFVLANNTLTGTKANFDTACTDGNFVYVGDTIAQAAGGTGGTDPRSAMAALKGDHVLASSAVAVSHTGDTLEFTLLDYTMPASAMGLNGRLRVTAQKGGSGTAGNHQIRIKFGGTTYYDSTAVAGASYTGGFHKIEVQNRNSASSQVGGGYGNFATSAVAATTSAVDTTAAVHILITGQLSNAADTITLESYLVELIVP